MPKKGAHPLLTGLLTVVDQRLAFVAEVAQLDNQLQWLIDLERLLDPTVGPEVPPPTSQSVAAAVDRYLQDLLAATQASGNQQDQIVAAHMDKTFRNLWEGLFQCYDVEELPRTNNELERFLRRIKTGQRRVSGRKNVQDFVIRYGSYVAFVDYRENSDALLQRLQKVSQAEFLAERRSLDASWLREQKHWRFRHQRTVFLQELENRWETALSQIQL